MSLAICPQSNPLVLQGQALSSIVKVVHGLGDNEALGYFSLQLSMAN
jgi:hypothetical protein